MKRFVPAILAMMLCAAAANAGESLSDLKGKMDKIAHGFHGTLGYSLHYRGKHDERISFNGDETFPTASTIKRVEERRVEPIPFGCGVRGQSRRPVCSRGLHEGQRG